MRRLSPAFLLCLVSAGCARGHQGLVQSMRPVSTPTVSSPKPQTATVQNPNVLTPTEKQMLQAEEKTPVQTTPAVKTLPPGKIASAISRTELKWRQEYESAERRPIESLRMGSGEQRIFVTSSLHGSESETVRTLEATLLALAQSNASMANRSVFAVRTPNPDGLVDQTLTNARGVDLNRNWPSSRFLANPTRLNGDAPASEPETRAMIQMLADFKPTRLIHIVSGGSERGSVVTNAPIKMLPSFDLIPVEETPAATVEDYAANRLQSEMVTLVLPAARDKSIDPQSVLQLAALITDQTPSFAGPVASPSAAANHSGSPVKLDGAVTETVAPAPKPDGTKGYVQLLPEPPGVTVVSEKSGVYFELPPPP
jgi:hypothetical protein